MPLYEYDCKQDGRFEVIRKFSDPPLLACPTCGQPIQKLPSAPAIQFKGSGWYVTDYAKKSGGGEREGKSKPEATKTPEKSATSTSGTPAATSTSPGTGSS